MKSDQLPVNEYPNYYQSYMQALENVQLIEELEICLHDFIRFVQNIPMDKFDYRYAEGKWTIKEVVQHMIDGERVFTYRALRFARKDDTPLPGFDENLFAQTAKADKRSWNDLVEEFAALRKSTESMFASFDNEQLEQSGIASENSTYVLGIGYIVAGHVNHHCQIIKERYL